MATTPYLPTMTSTTINLPTSLSDAVAAVEPIARRHALDAERHRVMAPEIMDALVGSGLLRMWVPRAYGGLEADPNESLDVMEHLARIDAATGWVVSNCVFISVIAQFLPEPVRASILGHPGVVACGTFVPPVRREPPPTAISSTATGPSAAPPSTPPASSPSRSSSTTMATWSCKTATR